jgi:hypothetical protein
VRRTTKLETLLTLIRNGAGCDGIYALAAAAGRPYRRVHDQVQRLSAAGLVRLEGAPRGPRALVRVLPVEPPLEERAEQPKLQFNRAWSRPSGDIDPQTTIAQVLARPTFRDLLACAKHYGTARVRAVYENMAGTMQLPPGAVIDSGRMLNNIEIGRARAAGIHSTGLIDRVEQKEATAAFRQETELTGSRQPTQRAPQPRSKRARKQKK